MTLEEIIRIFNGEAAPAAAPAAQAAPWQEMVSAAQTPQASQQQGLPAFPSLAEIQRATVNGAPGSDEMKAAELAALWPAVAAQTGIPMTPEQTQAAQYATQVLAQNQNYPEAGAGLMGFLGDIAPYAVGAIIGGAAAGVLGAPAGATSAAPAVEGLGGLGGLGAAGGAGSLTVPVAAEVGATGAGAMTGSEGLISGIESAATGGAGMPVAAAGAGGAAGGGIDLGANLAAAEAGANAAQSGFNSTASSLGLGGIPIQNIWNGSGTQSDWMRLAGQLGPSLLGMYASGQQADALSDLAQRYEGYGAPYRTRLEESYTNPMGYLSSPEVTGAVQQGTDALARSLSTQGNPAGSGNALHELQNYATNQQLNRLGQERDRLGGFGGLTQYASAAPGAATGAIGAEGNIYNAAGYGLGQVLNPQPSLSDIFRQYRGMGALG